MKRYSKEMRDAPPIPFRGLTIDDPVDGGFVEAKNVDFVNGEAIRRNPSLIVDDGETVMASRGYKNIFEFKKSDGKKYIYVDTEYDDTGAKLKVIASENDSSDKDISITSWATLLNGMTTGQTVKPAWATGQDLAFRVDGTNVNKVFRNATDAPTQCGVAAPTVAPTLAGTTGGALLGDQSYYVYYTYVKIISGYEVESYPSPKSLVIDLATEENAINVTYTGSLDPLVSNIRIYRNLAGTLQNYYKAIADVVNGDNTSKLILSDDDLSAATVLDFEAGAPPIAKDVVFAADRMWYMTDDMVMYSKDSQPENVPSLNYLFFDQNDGNELIGLGALRDSVMVFKRNKMWNVSLYSPFAKDVVSRNLGCVDKRTIVSTGSMNSLIWLSEEGVMAYSGGEIRNISENRINSQFVDFFNNSSEYIGRYDISLKQYHLIMFYRNSAQTEIVSYRHFVYNLQTNSNTWSEYKYINTDGEEVFATAISSATNASSVEVTTMGQTVKDSTLADFVQMYDLSTEETSTADVTLDTGDNVLTATDGSDNVYFYDETTQFVYKQTSAGVTSDFITKTEIEGLIPDWNEGHQVFKVKKIITNKETDSVYLLILHAAQDGTAIVLLSITSAGVQTSVSLTNSIANINTYPNGAFGEADMEIDSEGALYLSGAINNTSSPSVNSNIIAKVVDPSGSPVDSIYYGGFETGATSFPALGMTIDNNDNLYIPFVTGCDTMNDTGSPWEFYFENGTYELYKFTDVTGAVDQSAMLSSNASRQFDARLANSKTLYYLLGDLGEACELYKATLSGGNWTGVLISSVGTFTDMRWNILVTGEGGFSTSMLNRIERLYIDGSGRLVITLDNATEESGRIYRYWDVIEGSYFEDSWLPLGTGDEDMASLSNLSSSYVVYVNESGEVHKSLESTFFAVHWKWILKQFREYTSSGEGQDMDFDGIVVELVSVRTDFGVKANQKLFHRMYLETISEKTSSGVMYLEGDSTRRQSLHIDNESTTPDRAITGGGFASPGWETWMTEYAPGDGNMFDSEVDNRDLHRIDVKVKGSNYRWSLKLGDVTADTTVGAKTMIIKPPLVTFILMNMEGGQDS